MFILFMASFIQHNIFHYHPYFSEFMISSAVFIVYVYVYVHIYTYNILLFIFTHHSKALLLYNDCNEYIDAMNKSEHIFLNMFFLLENDFSSWEYIPRFSVLLKIYRWLISDHCFLYSTFLSYICLHCDLTAFFQNKNFQ